MAPNLQDELRGNLPGVGHMDVNPAPAVPGGARPRPARHSLVVTELLVSCTVVI
jgi:hypothetical protein